jgi:hypothetical protein
MPFMRKTGSSAPRSASTPRSMASTSLPPSSAHSISRKTASAGGSDPRLAGSTRSVSATFWSPTQRGALIFAETAETLRCAKRKRAGPSPSSPGRGRGTALSRLCPS